MGQDDLATPRAHPDHLDGCGGDLLDSLQVGTGVVGKIFELPHSSGVRLPSWKDLVDRFDLGQEAGVCREFFKLSLGKPIGRSDTELGEGVQDVELGQSDTREAVLPLSCDAGGTPAFFSGRSIQG